MSHNAPHRLRLRRGARAIVLAGVLAGLIGAALPAARAAGLWSATGSLAAARYLHTATLLLSGDVLVAGGRTGGGAGSVKAEIYHPSTGAWTRTGSMGTGRYGHGAVLLPNGKVLVAGSGFPYGAPDSATVLTTMRSAELYDPSTGKWSPTGSMVDAAWFRTITLLPNGKVLAAGGKPAWGADQTDHAELYDPVTGWWTATAPLAQARSNATANVVPNGKVLLAGGYDYPRGLHASAELYDPVQGTWSTAASLPAPRAESMSVTLANGKVLVFGGGTTGPNGKLDKRQLPVVYDPSTGRWSTTGQMVHLRWATSGTLLPNGQVLVAGGNPDWDTVKTATAEVYDPATNRWAASDPLAVARRFHTATLLPSGKVLIASGQGAGGVRTKTAELFSPPPGRATTRPPT